MPNAHTRTHTHTHTHTHTYIHTPLPSLQACLSPHQQSMLRVCLSQGRDPAPATPPHPSPCQPGFQERSRSSWLRADSRRSQEKKWLCASGPLNGAGICVCMSVCVCVCVCVFVVSHTLNAHARSCV